MSSKISLYHFIYVDSTISQNSGITFYITKMYNESKNLIILIKKSYDILFQLHDDFCLTLNFTSFRPRFCKHISL